MNTLQVIAGYVAHRWRGRFAIHRHAAAFLGEGHIAADDRAFEAVMFGTTERSPFRQQRVDTRAVVALLVILQNDLPVTLQPVLEFVGDAEFGQFPLSEAAHEGRHRFLKRRRYLSKIDKHKTAPFTHVRLMQAQIRIQPDILYTARNEIQHQFLSARKVKKMLGWEPLYNFDDGLRRTIPWYIDQLKENSAS